MSRLRIKDFLFYFRWFLVAVLSFDDLYRLKFVVKNEKMISFTEFDSLGILTIFSVEIPPL